MPEALSALPGLLQTIAPVLGLGATAAGLVGNIQNERAASQQQNVIKQDQKVLNTPALFNAQVAAAQQPLSSGLVQSVDNQVSGDLASKGLSEAPGIQATQLSQALAPFIQQNQGTAINEVLARLGGSTTDANSIFSSLHNSNLSPLLALLMRQNNPSPEAPTPYQVQGPPTSLAGSDVSGTLGDFSLPTGIWDA